MTVPGLIGAEHDRLRKIQIVVRGQSLGSDIHGGIATEARSPALPRYSSSLREICGFVLKAAPATPPIGFLLCFNEKSL